MGNNTNYKTGSFIKNFAQNIISKSLFCPLISEYRTELMGIATLLILLAHAVGRNVLFPFPLDKLIDLGTCGVDIFFFLSGFGLFYSLKSKSFSGLKDWYKKRYLRIYLPFLIISLVDIIPTIIDNSFSLFDYLYRSSLLSYWTRRNAPWFIATLVPLYAITPFLVKTLFYKGKQLLCFLLLVCIIVGYNFIQPKGGTFLQTVNSVLPHVIPFLAGFMVGDMSKKNQSIPLYIFILITLVFWSLYLLNGENGFLFIGCASVLLPLCIYLIMRLKQVNWIMSSMKWLGDISLESYLTNTTLPIYVFMLPVFSKDGLFSYGNYLAYLVIIAVGLFWAWIVHLICNRILQKTNTGKKK